MESKSLLKRILDKLKNTALFSIFLDPEAGQVIPDGDNDPHARISSLAHSTGTPRDEIANIDKAFSEAAQSLSRMTAETSRIPNETRNSRNPFKVDESELVPDEAEQAPRRKASGRKIGD